ncbi:DnaJ-domain-containing protein [Punctularia strigosozonata HHB-11173 SS5]|uniref:DnaJ-domain-containing protein n=1 Tax=Punctularia strigosozonata (strain HHB-11173) TaxID=741275 RepID=UPI00044175EA|nr:DnaJ-domain-containing protein [Punctularia strigosozonata HHB-11173 SS5]EIN08632.1 DnaJ-domain-containing protein [Punctularia strigosozonata HHB-11173 SS5]
MSDEEVDPYVLLGLQLEATDPEIRKAYRQRSLKVHPDRNPDNPDAPRLFHELTQAYELLLDPLRRMALDAKQRLARARKERFAAYDTKRKAMVEELEERERAFKKARVEKVQQERRRAAETEKIKEEGRRMREERERRREEEEAGARRAAEAEAAAGEDDPPVLGSYDTTVRLKYQISARPTLVTAESLVTLLAPFGIADASSVVLSMKPPKKAPHKPPKFATALVPFTQIGAAFAAVCASGRTERGLEGIEISWAEGKEPELIGWLKRHGQLGSTTRAKSKTPEVRVTSSPSTVPPPRPESSSEPASTAPFSSFPSTFPDFAAPPSAPTPAPASVAGLDFESLVLMRMRQAERERLEREILENEAKEG